MRVTVTVETDEASPTRTRTTVSNTRDVAVGGPHEWTGAIKRVTDELALLATGQLMETAHYDARRSR